MLNKNLANTNTGRAAAAAALAVASRNATRTNQHLATNQSDNGDSTYGTRLFLKKQLHLNLNVIGGSGAEDDKQRIRDGIGSGTRIDHLRQQQQSQRERSRGSTSSSRVTPSVPTTITTSTTTATRQHPWPSSLLSSSPTALAKFNQIIDNTVPTTNSYAQYRPTVDGLSDQSVVEVAPPPRLSSSLQQRLALVYLDQTSETMKRNDVHYLLKQLNSFSDIEEIEIVDMKQRQQQQQQQPPLCRQHKQSQSQRVISAVEKPVVTSPTTHSLVIISSPSTQSHKEGIHHQFDDYIFQSCHYLETNYFAANYCTAMVESSSHEFRPSTTTASESSKAQSLDAFAEEEPEPPSVIYMPPPTVVKCPLTPAATPIAVSTTTTLKAHQLQTRLTSSGVQTELTGITTTLMTTTATDVSLAQSSTSTDSSVVRRRMPFFKCCYTPIDRWRERRSGGGSGNQANVKKRATNGGGASGNEKGDHNPAGEHHTNGKNGHTAV